VPNLGGWEIVILVGVLLLLFGAKRLPTMARSVGQSARIFKGEMRGLRADSPATVNAEPPAPTAALPIVAEADATTAAAKDQLA